MQEPRISGIARQKEEQHSNKATKKKLQEPGKNMEEQVQHFGARENSCGISGGRRRRHKLPLSPSLEHWRRGHSKVLSYCLLQLSKCSGTGGIRLAPRRYQTTIVSWRWVEAYPSPFFSLIRTICSLNPSPSEGI